MTDIGDQSPPAEPWEAMRTSAFYGAVAASRRLDYIYVQNWKCGSSTVRSTLWAAEHELGLAAPPGNPHKPSPLSPFIADPCRWERVDEHFVFTIARNPYVRVLSAYLDKIDGHRDQKVWSRFAQQHGLGDRAIDFTEFLRIVSRTHRSRMDPHWRPQSFNLVPSLVPYDFIGSLENFEADLAYILTRIFPGRAIPIRDHKPHSTGAASRLAEFYGQEEIRLVREIYAQDFHELGYDLDLANPARRRAPERPDARIIRAWGQACRRMSERDFAAAEREFLALRPWIDGVYVEEQLLHCRCKLDGADRALVGQSVASLERALARGHEDWSVWKWYGHGLVKIGRWEDGLRAMLAATERQPGVNHRRSRRRRLSWHLALLLASKGRLREARSALDEEPATHEEADAGRLQPLTARMKRLTLWLVAAGAILTGARRWHPDRVMGIPQGGNGPQPQGAGAGG